VIGASMTFRIRPATQAGQPAITARVRAAGLNPLSPPLYPMCAHPLESYCARFGFRRIERGEMPPYFRRMTRVAAVFIAIAAFFGEQRHVIVVRHDDAALTA
jgi:hypothetical protein